MTATCDPSPAALRRAEAVRAAIGAVCVAAAILALTAARGALDVSRNDDWGFYRVTFRFAADGEFVLDGWGGMFFLGQALLAAPIIKLFGPELLPLQVLVATLGAVGVWATYVLLRGFLSTFHATVAVGCLVFGPVFGSLAASYMTDVPAMALSMVALLIASSGGAGRRPVARLVLALVVTTMAFTIREYSVAAGLAALVVHLIHARSRRLIVVVGAVWVAVVVGLVAWRSGLEHTVSYRLDVSPSSMVEGLGHVCASIVTLAFFVSPALLAVSFGRLRRTAGRVLVPALAVGLAVFGAAFASSRVFVGNYFTLRGPGSSFWDGSAEPVVPGWLLVAAALVALPATLVLVVLLARAAASLWAWARSLPFPALARAGARDLRHQPRSLVVAFAYLAAFGAIQVGVITVLAAPFFDRYLLSLVPVTAGLVSWGFVSLQVQPYLERRAVRSWVASVSAAVVLVLAGVAQLDGNATRDGLAWEVAEALVEQGVPAERVDGGPWEGLHQADLWMRAGQPSTACAEVRHVGAQASDGAVMVERRRTVFGEHVGFEAVVLDPDDPDCAPLVADR